MKPTAKHSSNHCLPTPGSSQHNPKHRQGSTDGWHLGATPCSVSIVCVYLDHKKIFSREDTMEETPGNWNKPLQTNLLNRSLPAHPGTHFQCHVLHSTASQLALATGWHCLKVSLLGFMGFF